MFDLTPFFARDGYQPPRDRPVPEAQETRRVSVALSARRRVAGSEHGVPTMRYSAVPLPALDADLVAEALPSVPSRRPRLVALRVRGRPRSGVRRGL